MKKIILQGVSSEDLFSPNFEARLSAEKTLSYNAGILFALSAMSPMLPEKGHQVQRNQQSKSIRRKTVFGK